MRTLSILLLLYPLLAQASTSLVDLLSASPDHSLLLKAFQRARLIPTLNRLNGSTLFAPTNEAIKREQEREKVDEERAISHLWSSLDLPLWTLASDEHDNLQLELRDTLLYHCLNYTLFPSPKSPPTSPNSSLPSDPPPTSSSSISTQRVRLPLDVVTLQESLYFPFLSSFNHSFPQPPSLPGSEPDKPDPGAPTDRPEGLLRKEGQKFRAVRKGKKELWIGGDWKGEGGFRVNEKEVQFAKNGAFVPVDGVLEKPKDLASIIQSDPSLSTFSSLLTPALLSYLSQTSHLTLFAPTNEAWNELSELEMRYLRSEFSEIDMGEIVGDATSRTANGTAGHGGGKRTGRGVGYLQRLLGSEGGDTEDGENETLIETVRNGTLELEKNEEGEVSVNGTKVQVGDILAKNGVLHTLPSLLLPKGSLALTSEKYLLALNCTKFVSLLHSVNLSDYVQIPSNQDTTILPEPMPHLLDTQLPLVASRDQEEERPLKKGYTILALKDSLLSSSSSSSEKGSIRLLTLPSFPSPGSQELRRLLSYHILPSKLLPHQLEDGILLGTELRPSSLGGDRQRLVVSVQSEEGGEGEGWEKGGKSRKGKSGEKEVVIGFGNANAIAEPVEVGNSIIYLISTILEPPTSVISTAVSDLRLSTFIASVYSAKLDKHFSSTPSTTFLIPTNQAFERLGLTMSYLLLPTAKEELESTLKYHALDEVVYSEGFPTSGSARYPTLEAGSEIYLERGGGGTNTTFSVHGPTLGGYPANGEQRDGRIVELDQLTETGVLHILDQVELPPTVEITVDKLMKGARSTTMVELIKEANMSWILEGKEEDEGEEGTVRRAYTILCPTDKALSRLNLTYYLTHPPALSSLIKLHIIPTDALLSSSSSSSTPLKGEEEGTPLLLSDSITYPTLHSIEEGGKSKYGKVAFKRWGTERGSWMVGIEGARGTKGESDSARVVNWGRATPWIVQDDLSLRRGGSRTRVAAGGGVILIDSVLLPWEPGWFRRWGWIVLTAVLASLVLVLLGIWGVKKWRNRLRKNGEGYERVAGEED